MNRVIGVSVTRRKSLSKKPHSRAIASSGPKKSLLPSRQGAPGAQRLRTSPTGSMESPYLDSGIDAFPFELVRSAKQALMMSRLGSLLPPFRDGEAFILRRAQNPGVAAPSSPEAR